MKRDSNTKSGLFFGFLIFLGLGVFMIYFWMNSMKEIKASKSWPSVEGKVISSTIEIKQQESNGKMINIFYPKVRYGYFVSGSQLFNDRISFGDYGSNKRKSARKICNKYPADLSVTVFYNPQNPSISVLERKGGLGNLVALAVGILFCLGGVLLFVTLIKKLING